MCLLLDYGTNVCSPQKLPNIASLFLYRTTSILSSTIGMALFLNSAHFIFAENLTLESWSSTNPEPIIFGVRYIYRTLRLDPDKSIFAQGGFTIWLYSSLSWIPKSWLQFLCLSVFYILSTCHQNPSDTVPRSRSDGSLALFYTVFVPYVWLCRNNEGVQQGEGGGSVGR